LGRHHALKLSERKLPLENHSKEYELNLINIVGLFENILGAHNLIDLNSRIIICSVKSQLQCQPPISKNVGTNMGTPFFSVIHDNLFVHFQYVLDGGPAVWAIGVLSVFGLTLILLKLWRLIILGAWMRKRARGAMSAFHAGNLQNALNLSQRGGGIRARFLQKALTAKNSYPIADAKDEVTRVAKGMLADASRGLRGLELIASIAPLLGLLGTVLGMIAAFQALQESGAGADPAILAGGIWEALLTTAAGMAVAIPASIALSWFEGVVEGIHNDLEDIATQVFVYQPIASDQL
jgi:biopolymer transport protein ExbB